MKFPDTFAIDLAAYIFKIAAILAGVAITIFGAGVGYTYFKVAGAFTGTEQDAWLGLFVGGFLGVLASVLMVLPVWVIFEIIDILIAIELNTRITANRTEEISAILKRKP